MRNAFYTLDKAILSSDEIREVVKRLQQETSDAQHQDIMNVADTDKSDALDFVEFIHYQYILQQAIREERLGRAAKRRRRLKFKNRHYNNDQLRHLQDQFEKYDTDNSGSLKMPEISSALEDLGMFPVSVEEQKSLSGLLANAGFQTELNFDQFITLIHSIRVRVETQQEEEYMALARSYNYKDEEVDDFFDIFIEFDKTNEGKLKKEDTRKILSSLGMTIPLSLFDDIFDSLDTDHSGELEFGEFLGMMKAVGDSLNTDQTDSQFVKKFSMEAKKLQPT